MFAGSGRDNGTQRNFNRLCQIPPCLHTQFIQQLSIIAPILEQVLYLHFLGSQGESQSIFLSLLGLDCFQLQMFLLSKKYFWVANFVPLQQTGYGAWIRRRLLQKQVDHLHRDGDARGSKKYATGRWFSKMAHDMTSRAWLSAKSTQN